MDQEGATARKNHLSPGRALNILPLTTKGW